MEVLEEPDSLTASDRGISEAAERQSSAGPPSTSGRKAPGQEFTNLGVDDRLTVSADLM